jgi:formamidopyrimidine-DNA glycosylase
LPELPEVETTMRGITPLVGQTVSQVIIRFPKLRWPIPSDLNKILPALQLDSMARRAKYILLNFKHPTLGQVGTLIMHLGMSGRICLLPKFEAPSKHDHVDIEFNTGQVLRLRDPRRFGAVLWAEHVANHPLILNLGVEPLEPIFDGNFLFKKTRTKTVSIKTLVMDSHLVVGVGNIYASESLFRAGINPKKSAGRLTLKMCERLVAEIKATLSEAIEAGGSSLRDFFGADGNPGYFQQSYYVYGRQGEPCLICGTKILKIKQGQRSTFYCPNCQS